MLSIHLIVRSLAFFNWSNTVGWGSAQACRQQKKHFRKYSDVSVELPNVNGNERELGIARWEKWEWDSCFWREWERDGNGNDVIETGGIWYEKSIPAHLYITVVKGRSCGVLSGPSSWPPSVSTCTVCMGTRRCHPGYACRSTSRIYHSGLRRKPTRTTTHLCTRAKRSD